MKILLLNPSYSKKKLSTDPILTRCTGVPSKAPYTWPPIGLAYIASAIKELSDADVKIIDARVDGFEIGMAKDFNLVVINTGTPTINFDIQLSQKIKELNGPKVALIGVHAAFFHNELAKCCDFIIRGEPDTVLANLVNCIERGQDARRVNGITWNDRGHVCVNKNEKPIENLDGLPFQAIDLLSKKYYDILTKRRPIAFMITSRGCPFRCAFCSAKFYSGKYRYRSAKHVVDEMKFLLNKGFKDITFFDDSFTANKKRVIDLCDIIQEDKLDVTWRCLSRVDALDGEMLKKMKQAGCYQVQFGVESGNQSILNSMKKGISIERIWKTFGLCDSMGIETVGFFMLGYPGETIESINETIKTAHKISPDFVTFNLFTPLPGSEIFNSMDKKEWEQYDFTSTSFCDIPSEKMVELIGKAYRGYYLRPSYLFRRISKTREPIRILRQNLKFWTKRSGVLWDFIKLRK
jgi:radical SAM superfamily enzyme YgiQ (UPF0313 family)